MELRGHLANEIPLLGRAHDSPQHGRALPCEEPGNDFVRPDHEVFDQFFGPVFRIESQVDDVPVLQNSFRLDRLQVERAAQ